MTDPGGAIEAVWWIESPKLIASLARIVRDVALAEDFAQDAFVAALKQWPADGIPDNPGAWLTTTAKRRAIDHFRRDATGERILATIADDMERIEMPEEDVEDDLLRLIFSACHPVLSQEARVAMTLRLIGGLATEEIARAFLVPESTLAQRIVRAKRTLPRPTFRSSFPPPPNAPNALRRCSR